LGGGGGQFVGIGKDGRTVVAAETDPRNAHDFEIIANGYGSKVRIKAPNGRFLQVLVLLGQSIVFINSPIHADFWPFMP
jgi:hypothetical protein